VLRDITSRFHALGALVHEEEDDEVLLHASPRLTIYHITLSPGLQYPPHNHLMDALIGIYKGGETNFVYPVAAGKLEIPERRDCTAPAVVHLPPHTSFGESTGGELFAIPLHRSPGWERQKITDHLEHIWGNSIAIFTSGRRIVFAIRRCVGQTVFRLSIVSPQERCSRSSPFPRIRAMECAR
jgi:hypothetical protein